MLDNSVKNADNQGRTEEGGAVVLQPPKPPETKMQKTQIL
jgi:hypothetical protein